MNSTKIYSGGRGKGSSSSTTPALIVSCTIVLTLIFAVAFIICKRYRVYQELIRTATVFGVVHAEGDTFYLMENLSASQKPLVSFPPEEPRQICRESSEESSTLLTPAEGGPNPEVVVQPADVSLVLDEISTFMIDEKRNADGSCQYRSNAEFS